jgi:hypothetical protein
MNTPLGSFNERTLVPGIIITLVAFLAGIFFFLNNGGKKISVKVFLIYTLATVLLFALMGLTAFSSIENPLNYFIGIQVGMLILGILHVVAFSYLTGSDEDSNFWHEFVFTIYVTLLGGFIYFILRTRLSEPTAYELLFLTSLLVFVVPFLFYKTFTYLISIPAKEYEKWYFPIDKNFDEDVEDDYSDTKTIITIVNVIGQTSKDQKLIHGEALTPLRYEFGNWLAAYFLARNERKPGEQIEYLDEYGQPQGWNFYVKPKWYQSPRYLNSKLTIAENEIAEKDVIICERV